MRLAAYGAISTVVASGVVLQAFHQRANFYSACVHLAQSNACVMILTNFGFFMTLMFGKMIQKIFYGPLRPAEVEHLYEKAWYAITETCLAMTIFRDEFHSGFVMMFTILLFLKCFHWLGSDRVDFMEQTPPTRPYLFHARLSTSLIMLFLLDVFLTRHCVLTLMQLPKPNMLVMFAFEFAILTIAGSSTLARYFLGVVEKMITVRKTRLLRERRRRVLQRRVNRGVITEEQMRDTLEEEEEAGDVVGAWEGKSAWLFNMEIATDLVKLAIYLLFFGIVLMFYGLPLHIIRDVYLTVRSFIRRCRDFIRYRKATAQMNSRYPDATREEIAREAVCIICREEMVAWSDTPGTNPEEAAQEPSDEEDIIDERMRPKKLPCGHVLHLACLKSWMERQQRCPTCRRPVLDEQGQPGQPQPQGVPPPDAVPGQNGNAGPVPPQNPQQQQPGQQQGQGQQGQPRQDAPPGFGVNMFGAGGPGGIIGALARNLAQRQNGLQPIFDPNVPVGQQQVPPNPQNAQNMPNQQNQQNQPNQPDGTGQQNQQPQPTPTQPAAGVQGDIASQLQQNSLEVVRLLMQEVMAEQRYWNQNMLEQMVAMATEMRNLRASVGQTATSGAPAVNTQPTATSAVPSPTPTQPPAGLSGASASVFGRSRTATPVRTGEAPVDGVHNINQAFPPGFQLPPGWSIVPLYPVAQSAPGASVFATPQHAQQSVVYTTPSPTPHQPSTSSANHSPNPDISLSTSGIRRRGVQRQYSNNLHTYHSMTTPRGEPSNPFSPPQNPSDTASTTTTTEGSTTSSSLFPGATMSQQTPNSNVPSTPDNTIPSPIRQMATLGLNHGQNGTSPGSPSRHGSISTTSREVLERRHRDAHSPRAGSNLSPAGSIRNSLTNNHPIMHSNTHPDQASRASPPMHTSPIPIGRREMPHLDTSAEHNHALDSTHDPHQGRSPVDERRRASAGEILLSETDTAWPIPTNVLGSGPTSDASASPGSSLPGSRVGSVRRGRRPSIGVTAGSPTVGTQGMFNVIPRSQTSSAVGSPVIGHATGTGREASPTGMSLDSITSEGGERGRRRIKEEEGEES